MMMMRIMMMMIRREEDEDIPRPSTTPAPVFPLTLPQVIIITIIIVIIITIIIITIIIITIISDRHCHCQNLFNHQNHQRSASLVAR